MNEQNRKMELLGAIPVPKALLALGLPTMIGMLINALYNLADTYFVGGLGTDQMGAVTVAFPLGQIVVGLGLLFGNGAAAYLSRLLGRYCKYHLCLNDRCTFRMAVGESYSSIFRFFLSSSGHCPRWFPIFKSRYAFFQYFLCGVGQTSIYVPFLFQFKSCRGAGAILEYV